MERKLFLVEYADKLTILLLPYLFLISYCYNLGYWGNLRFDIYNYLSFEDLLKGVGTAVQGPFSTTIIVGSLSIFAASFAPLLFKHTWLVILILLLCFGGLAWAQYVTAVQLPANGFVSLEVPVWATVFTTALPLSLSLFTTRRLFGTTAASQKNKKGTRWSVVISESVFFVLFALPINALITGLNNADNLVKHYQFDYIAKPSYERFEQLKAYPYLIYVGKAGDFHLLLSPDGKRRIAMPKDSLAIVTLSDFNINGAGMTKEALPK
ncbi:hypothetical protein [Hymenobacter metallicola]|uniref:Uncharacterized protein n=1 Tax=Hymenobacter metallicola TaxID=2563114 RepID=A0A4Z0Q0I4_9BACT|nr:hypothetical protein [Hymenobacter metallicola]TGE23540.1 hypothetical protein E5K02_20355 [Hymenobacter metallicola]